jgi:hypothetical protein
VGFEILNSSMDNFRLLMVQYLLPSGVIDGLLCHLYKVVIRGNCTSVNGSCIPSQKIISLLKLGEPEMIDIKVNFINQIILFIRLCTKTSRCRYRAFGRH